MAEPANIDEEGVRRTAYFLWEQDGRPEGRAQEDWYRAWAQHRRMRGYDDELRGGLEGETVARLPIRAKQARRIKRIRLHEDPRPFS